MKKPRFLALLTACLFAVQLSAGAASAPVSGSAAVYGDIHCKPKPIADIDKDGVKDLVFAAADGQIHIFSSKKNKEIIRPPFWPKHTGGPIIGEIQVADLDGDGEQEIIASSQDGNVYCISSKGKTKWKASIGGRPLIGPVLEGLNGAKNIDAIMCLGSELRWFNCDGRDITNVVDVAGNARKCSGTSFTVGDPDNDYLKEIVTKGGRFITYYKAFLNSDFKLTHKMLWQKRIPFLTLPMAWPNKVTMNDYSGSGRDEIFTTYRILDSNHKICGCFYALDNNGSQLSYFKLTDAAFAAPLVADITGDGRREIIIAQANGQVVVCDRQGNMKPGWPWPAKPKPSWCIYSEPIILDIDGDMRPDLVFTVCDPSKEGLEAGFIMALDSRGVQLDGYPKYIGEVMAGLTFADLNEDGFLEMIAVGGMNYTGRQFNIFSIKTKERVKIKSRVKIAVIGQSTTFK